MKRNREAMVVCGVNRTGLSAAYSKERRSNPDVVVCSPGDDVVESDGPCAVYPPGEKVWAAKMMAPLLCAAGLARRSTPTGQARRDQEKGAAR